MCSNSSSGAGAGAVPGAGCAPAPQPLGAVRDAAVWPPDYGHGLEHLQHEYHGAACPYPPSVLDFLQLRGVDSRALEETWPCEVRAYWVRDLQPFVLFVRFIYAYFTLLVVFTGMVLNCFALRVWSSRSMRGTSLAVYLRALSLSDMGALLCTYFLGYWRAHHTAFNTLFLNSDFCCRLHKVLVSTFPMTSQWLQTALTVERLLVVWRPLRARNPAYPKVAVRAAKRTVAAVYSTLILVAFTKWYFSGFEQYSAFDYQRCEHKRNTSVVAVYVYVALSTYLPGTIIFISNVMLFFRLRRSDSLRRSLFAGSAHANDGAFYNSDAAARTLVFFSLLYLLLQLPLGIVETVELYWDVSLYRRPPNSSATGAAAQAKREAYISWLCRKLQLKWSRSLLFWLFQLSFVLNFVVYLKSGGRFRAVAKELAWQYLSCGLQPVWSLHRKLSTWSSRLPAPNSTPAAPAAPICDALNADPEAPIPLISTSGSTGSFSSDSSGGNPATPDASALCWRGPRRRARTNSCPHRWALRRPSPSGSPSRSPRRYSPCRPCRRARIYTWASVMRSQGLSLPRRVAVSIGCSVRSDHTLLSSPSSTTLSTSLEGRSVFDSSASPVLDDSSSPRPDDVPLGRLGGLLGRPASRRLDSYCYLNEECPS